MKDENSGRRGRKWSLWRHFKSASRKKQLAWIMKGVGWLLGIVVVPYAGYVLSHQPTVSIVSIPCAVNPDGSFKYNVYMQNPTENDADNFSANCPMFINDRLPTDSEDHTVPHMPTPFGAHALAVVCGGGVTKADAFRAIADGKTTLDIYVQWSFRGPLLGHATCIKERYVGRVNGFTAVEVCDARRPLPQ